MIDVQVDGREAELVLGCTLPDCTWESSFTTSDALMSLADVVNHAQEHVREAHAAKPSGCPGCPGPRVAHQHYATGGIDAVLAAQGYVGDWTNYDVQASS